MGASRTGLLGLPAMRPWGGALSSAILYVAIVAIWAIVLVPRWVRLRSVPPPQPVPLPAQEPAPDAGHTESEPEQPQHAPAAPQPTPAAPRPAPVASRPAPAAPRPAPAAPRPAPAAAHVPAEPPARPADRNQAAGARGTDRPGHTGRRASILRARRRMLATLTLLTAVAAAITLLQLAPGWVIIPPVLMLAGLLVLLREAAHTDAQRRRHLAGTSPSRSRPVAGHRQAPHTQPAQAPGAAAAAGTTIAAPQTAATPGTDEFPAVSALVIDISARIQDQLYDQYTDAAERAVGD
jgi:hypothetical protein